MGYIVGRSSSPTGRGSGSYYAEALVPLPKGSKGAQAVGRRGRQGQGQGYGHSGPGHSQAGAKGGTGPQGTRIGIGFGRAEFYATPGRRRTVFGSKCLAFTLLACAAVLAPLGLVAKLHLPLQFLSPELHPASLFTAASISLPSSPGAAHSLITGHRDGDRRRILEGVERQREAGAVTATEGLAANSHTSLGEQQQGHGSSPGAPGLLSQVASKVIRKMAPRIPEVANTKCPTGVPLDAAMGVCTARYVHRRVKTVADLKVRAAQATQTQRAPRSTISVLNLVSPPLCYVFIQSIEPCCVSRGWNSARGTPTLSAGECPRAGAGVPQGAANERGAYSRHNQKYDETGSGVWYIEEQFYGILYIQAGLAFNNSDALHIGMKIFDWGFRQQKEDGSFDCPDVYHSAGFFLEASSRGALLLRAYAPGAVYQEWTKKAEAHIAALAAWFVRPDIEAKGWKLEAAHAHRRYLLGCALGLAGLVTRNQTLVDRSRVYVYSGLLKQDPAGFNREHGGYDCSYQGIGLTYAARYYLYVADTEAKANLENMARRGVSWLMMRVNLDGTLNATGNTRTGLSQEIGRSGKPKAMAKNDVFSALMYWGWILGDEGAEDAAWLVETERSGRQRDNRCNCHFKPSPRAFTKR